MTPIKMALIMPVGAVVAALSRISLLVNTLCLLESHTLSTFFSHRKPSQQRHHQYSQSGWQQQQQELVKYFRK
jgi:hypothetical protein